MEEKINFSLPVSVFGNLTPFNDVISKARVRIFYKGLNRNNTYITDRFAEKLLSTLSYSPVCGIYDDESEDFTDHGETRSIAKAYGVVPENPNISWEKHLDEDGVEREYACADVLLWTARYKEANDIVGKSHSMELYQPSIKGEWKYANGRKFFEFTDGCFIGLTPLGDNVEPCFEGSAFYSLADSLKEMFEELKNYQKATEKELNEGGQEEMTLNFKLSDREKHEAIWSLLNTNFTEEGKWIIEYEVLDIYDEYALVYNYENREYFRVQYTKNDENNEVVLGERELTYIMDVSETEYNALKALKSLNNDTYENIDSEYSEKIASIETLNASLEENKGAIDEVNAQLQANEEKIGELNTQIETLQAEKDSLNEYKLEKELAEKKAILDSYADKLDEEIVNEFSVKLTDYATEDLKKELAFKLVETNPSIFSKNDGPLIPHITDDDNDASLSPAAKLLKRHQNRKHNGGEK